MDFEYKMLLCKLYKYKKSKGMLSLNFDKDAIDMDNIERDMKIRVGRR